MSQKTFKRMFAGVLVVCAVGAMITLTDFEAKLSLGPTTTNPLGR